MHNMQQLSRQEFEILGYFYRQKTGYVRQIKNGVKLSEHTLLKYLDLLEKRKVLDSRKEGNLKIYKINMQSPFTRIFFSCFDLQRLEALEYGRRRAIEEFVRSIKGFKLPYFILLFGSTAKGTDSAKSDIDIIVVYETFGKVDLPFILDIKRGVQAVTGIRISPIVMQISEFLREKANKENFSLQAALQTGFPVFGSQLYYEVLFDEKVGALGKG